MRALTVYVQRIGQALHKFQLQRETFKPADSNLAVSIMTACRSHLFQRELLAAVLWCTAMLYTHRRGGTASITAPDAAMSTTECCV